MQHKERNGENRRKWLKYLSFGSELVILLGLGVYLGLKLDSKCNSLPLFTILFPGVGMVFSFWKLFKNIEKDR